VDDKGQVVNGLMLLPVIYWDRLVDNAAEMRVGWSFIKDSRNKSAINIPKPKLWLSRRVTQEK
ncbi:hypothetical protein K469DRAFT_568632, partial [Zopfia rhizophila CBS 207.26]